jgi:hypothetical protein
VVLRNGTELVLLTWAKLDTIQLWGPEAELTKNVPVAPVVPVYPVKPIIERYAVFVPVVWDVKQSSVVLGETILTVLVFVQVENIRFWIMPPEGPVPEMVKFPRIVPLFIVALR